MNDDDDNDDNDDNDEKDDALLGSYFTNTCPIPSLYRPSWMSWMSLLVFFFFAVGKMVRSMMGLWLLWLQ